MVIMRVYAKVLGQVSDASGEQGNLDLGRSCVAVVSTEFGDCLLGRSHLLSLDPRSPDGRGEKWWGRLESSTMDG